VFKDALRLARRTERLDRLDSCFADDDDFAGFDVAHVGCADQVEGTRLGTDHPAVPQPSQSERPESVGIADADYAVPRQHHKRECTANLRDRVYDGGLHALLAGPGKEVDHDLRVAVGLKYGASSHQRVPQFARIHEVAVVTHRKLSMDAVD